MRKWAIRVGFAIAVCTLGAAAASAQYPPAGSPFVPYQTPANYQPDMMYNRAIQPLNPYLNLLRGGLPSVNYYYGVRPGLQSGGYGLPGNVQYPGLRPIRPVFLPTSPPGTAREAIPPGFEYATSPKETTLSPAGHPVQFANTGGYFPGMAAPRQGGFTKPQQTTAPKKP